MVQTGPKRPRGGEKEMWLTPDPLTPLENLSRRRRSSKPSTRKLSLVRSASKSVKKKAAAESTSAVAGDESPRAESVSRADNQGICVRIYCTYACTSRYWCTCTCTCTSVA